MCCIFFGVIDDLKFGSSKIFIVKVFYFNSLKAADSTVKLKSIYWFLAETVVHCHCEQKSTFSVHNFVAWFLQKRKFDISSLIIWKIYKLRAHLIWNTNTNTIKNEDNNGNIQFWWDLMYCIVFLCLHYVWTQ